jgi:RNA polymerase sigma-54 factor
MLRQGQYLNQQQKFSPQQILLMKILPLPTTAIEQRIQEELEANPVLEAGEEYEEPMSQTESDVAEDNFGEETNDDFREEEEVPIREEEYELDDFLERYMEDDPSVYKTKSIGQGGDEEEKTVPIASENSFHEYLVQQLGLLDLTDKHEIMVALQIIGSIDDDGYLRREPEAIMDDLLFSMDVITNVREIKRILERIQRLDPPGIGAKDLQECLLLQIRAKSENEKLDDDCKRNLRIAARIIHEFFDEFTKKHYPRMQRQLGCTEDQLKASMDEILKLNPKPASGHTSNSERNSQYIVPDFIIENREGRLELTVDSRNVPDLRISEHYKEMLKAYKNTRDARRTDRMQKDAVMFIKQKIDSAKWFIDAIRQREQTMFKTMYAILQYQYEFFLTGDANRLKPMILKDIADVTSLDISTVSRVANSKYVQTEYGTKRLKDFFSESLQTSEGEEVSTLEVKNILTTIITAESKRKPLSDEKLKSTLQEKGYNIARRTVAKYREQLNIPVARLRKEL